MEHVCSSTKNEEENPLYLDFPSPFFDDISTILASPNKALNITEPEPEPSDQSKRVKKRNVGKKDRHSKIHTAQGPRDRRMRLSLQIARKFFDLQDLLGFDKASDTIEWLFCKSNKDIIEVAKNFNLQQTNHKQNTSEEIETMDNSKDEEIKNRDSGKQILNNYSIKETRDQARARARERTRERMMIRELEKSKQVFGGNNSKDEIYKLGLGYLGNPNILNIEELGYTSCPPATIQQESRTHHLDESTYCSPMINHNPPAGWLDSCNEFLRMSGDCDAGSLLTDYYNYGIVPSTSQLTSDIYEQDASSFFMSTTNNILQFQSRNQGK